MQQLKVAGTSCLAERTSPSRRSFIVAHQQGLIDSVLCDKGQATRCMVSHTHSTQAKLLRPANSRLSNLLRVEPTEFVPAITVCHKAFTGQIYKPHTTEVLPAFNTISRRHMLLRGAITGILKSPYQEGSFHNLTMGIALVTSWDNEATIGPVLVLLLLSFCS